jgi:hypothetical protein
MSEKFHDKIDLYSLTCVQSRRRMVLEIPKLQLPSFGNQYQCQRCPAFFNENRAFRRHFIQHFGTRLQEFLPKIPSKQCKLCGKKFAGRKELIYHVAYKEGILCQLDPENPPTPIITPRTWPPSDSESEDESPQEPRQIENAKSFETPDAANPNEQIGIEGSCDIAISPGHSSSTPSSCQGSNMESWENSSMISSQSDEFTLRNITGPEGFLADEFLDDIITF